MATGKRPNIEQDPILNCVIITTKFLLQENLLLEDTFIENPSKTSDDEVVVFSQGIIIPSNVVPEDYFNFSILLRLK